MSEKPWWGERAVHEFTFPKSLQYESGCKKVGMVELTWDDEERATQLGSSSASAFLGSLTRLSVATIDGRIVEQDGIEVQKLWHCGMKVRTLLLAARAKVQEPASEDMRGFLDSVTLSV